MLQSYITQGGNKILFVVITGILKHALIFSYNKKNHGAKSIIEKYV